MSQLSDPQPILPHGGALVERMVDAEERASWLSEAARLPRLSIDRRALSDIRLLGVGALSPLEGFMSANDYERVVHEMRLASGLVWTLPVTLAVDSAEVNGVRGAKRAALYYKERPVAVIEIQDIYQPDKRVEALEVYGVDDPRHPGVRAIYQQGDSYIGGPVHVLDLVLEEEGPLAKYYLSPRETRRIFQQRGWRKVVAFQTRNPVHRAHEYLHKCALELADGLLLHPLAGATKEDDIDVATRFACYERLIEKYYPVQRVLLAAFPASMRYAGPREAVFHALCRKNYGCTHLIVGRDHAGVGNFYGTYDAQKIFERFTPQELGIQPLPFENAFYCRICQGMATSRTCPHERSAHVTLSGTAVREMLQRGQAPPPEFTRPEIAEILIQRTAAARPTLPAGR